MSQLSKIPIPFSRSRFTFLRSTPKICVLAVLVSIPLSAFAQGSPFDNGFTALQTLFTGTIAKVASLIAIVIGGYQFAHGEPGGKKALAGVAAGTGIAVLAASSSMIATPSLAARSARWLHR